MSYLKKYFKYKNKYMILKNELKIYLDILQFP